MARIRFASYETGNKRRQQGYKGEKSPWQRVKKVPISQLCYILQMCDVFEIDSLMTLELYAACY